MSSARPHVVIVGAGFGGLATARSLADAPVDVTLVDAEPPEGLALLEAGTVDLALVFGYDTDEDPGAGLRWEPAGSEPVHLVTEPGQGYRLRP